mgnify:CR=1 FL=1
MFAQIILAVDGSELSLEAIRQAHGLGLLDSAELHVLAAFDSASVTLGGLLDLSRERMDALHDEVVRTCLDPAEALLEELGLNAASRRMIHSDPVQGLVDEAKRVKAELLVCGRRGFGAVRPSVLELLEGLEALGLKTADPLLIADSHPLSSLTPEELRLYLLEEPHEPLAATSEHPSSADS